MKIVFKLRKLNIVANGHRIKGDNFSIVVENDDQVEVSFTRLWDSSKESTMVPLNIDIR